MRLRMTNPPIGSHEIQSFGPIMRHLNSLHYAANRHTARYANSGNSTSRHAAGPTRPATRHDRVPPCRYPKPLASPPRRRFRPIGGFLWIVILVLVAGGIGFIVWRAKSTKAAATAAAKRADLSVPITPGKVTRERGFDLF